MTLRQVVHTDDAPKAVGPYAQGVWAGDLFFVSGQVPLHPTTGQLAEGGAAGQASQSLRNAKAILEAAGLSLAHVVKTTLFLTNMDDFPTVNEVYASYFQPPYPARATMEVSRLPKDALVEIEMVAKR